MLEYLVIIAFALVFTYFIYKYFFEQKKVWASNSAEWNLPREKNAPRFSKPMKPFYFQSKKKAEPQKKITLETIAACSICRVNLNAMSKMTCPKCLEVFCSKHVQKHKCKKKKFPKYGMDSKKYYDGTVVYYTDRKVPIT